MTEKMKPSGIAWIGEIPTGWDVKRVKYVIQNNADGIKVGPFGSALTNEVVSSEEGQYKIYGQANLIRKDFNYGDNFVTEENYRRLINYEVLPDDIAVSMMGTIGKCSVVPYGIQPGIMDSHLIKIRLSKKMSPRFFEYIYESCVVYEQLVVNSKGSIMNGLNSTIVKSVFMAVPSIDEQTAIADFLDAQCAKIDSVIADIEKQIETLQKYKKSLITETVTKGCTAGSKTKTVRLDFADEINEAWIETRVKYLCSMYSGDNLTSSDIEPEGDYPVYGGNGLRGFYAAYTNDGEHVLIGRQGALCGNVHLVSGKFWATDHAVVTYPYEGTCNGYLFYLFSAMNLNQYSQTAAQPGLAVAAIQNLSTCIPPTTEIQQEIAKYLDEKCGKIDSIIEAKRKQLEIMEEHKKSLIYEYVTGKKRVTEVN